MHVPQLVTVRTWCCWLLRTKARAARRAKEHALSVGERGGNWVKDLTSQERELIDWAGREDAGTD